MRETEAKRRNKKRLLCCVEREREGKSEFVHVFDLRPKRCVLFSATDRQSVQGGNFRLGCLNTRTLHTVRIFGDRVTCALCVAHMQYNTPFTLSLFLPLSIRWYFFRCLCFASLLILAAYSVSFRTLHTNAKIWFWFDPHSFHFLHFINFFFFLVRLRFYCSVSFGVHKQMDLFKMNWMLFTTFIVRRINIRARSVCTMFYERYKRLILYHGVIIWRKQLCAIRSTSNAIDSHFLRFVFNFS